MAPSFDYAVSSLLCGEDNSIFDDNDYGVVVEEFEATWHHLGHRSRNQDRGFGGGGGSDGVPLQSDECLALMVEKECQYLPGGDYLKKLLSGDLDLGARKQAVDWIGKVGFCLAFCFCCVNERVYALYVHVCFWDAFCVFHCFLLLNNSDLYLWEIRGTVELGLCKQVATFKISLLVSLNFWWFWYKEHSS